VPDLILSTIASYLVPLIWVYGAYVIVHGHLSPGGGFAGGTIIASGFVLAALTWGFDRIRAGFDENVLGTADTAGVLAYVSIGLAALIRGGWFLSNLGAGYPPGIPGRLFSSGAVWLLGAAIGVKVTTTLYGLFARLAESQPAREGQPRGEPR